jgi:hypothetical protein
LVLTVDVCAASDAGASDGGAEGAGSVMVVAAGAAAFAAGVEELAVAGLAGSPFSASGDS